MDNILNRHTQLIEQIVLYESLVSANNVEAIKILSHIKKELQLIINEIETSDTKLLQDSPLSPRETEVLTLAAKGEPNKEIAYQLNISSKTVQFHLKSIFRKLEVSSRTEASIEAIKRKIIIL